MRDAVLAAAIAVWSAAMIGQFVGVLTVGVSAREVNALLFGPPVVLALVWAGSDHRPSLPLQTATGFSALLAAILYLTPRVVADPTLAYAIPGLLALTWLVSVRPAVGVTAVILVTASFGSLSIYLAWPYKRTIVALFAALWLAALARLAAGRRTEAMRLPIGVALSAAYLLVSLAQVTFSSVPGVAAGGFQLAPLYMTALLIVTYSDWSDETHVRIARAIVAIAALVGAYATLRQIIGPSGPEARAAALSPYNFVAGKQRQIGSFLEGPELAAWTSLMIPFCLSFALGARGRLRLTALAALPLLAVGLFASQARAGSVAVLVSALVIIVLHGFTRSFSGAKLGRTMFALALLAALVLGGYAVAGSSSRNSGHNYLSLLEGNTNDTSVAAHAYKWKLAIRDLKGHPLGYGLGTAPAGYVANAPSSPVILQITGFSVDNGFLKIALEQGLVVMGAFAAGLAMLAVGAARAGVLSADPMRAGIAIGAAGTAVSFFVLEGAGVYADGVPAVAGWIVIGLGTAQAARRGAERRVYRQARASYK
jgi:hypothetical protein